MIAEQVKVNGSGKAGSDWFHVDTASVSYDHPYDMPLEYTLNLDFTAQNSAPAVRVAVELDADSARKLVQTIQEVIRQAEQGDFVERVA